MLWFKLFYILHNFDILNINDDAKVWRIMGVINDAYWEDNFLKGIWLHDTDDDYRQRGCV
jgi:hypothetical protein